MTTSGSTGRVYGGQTSADREAGRRRRLLDAAIDTLISGDKLTVRGVCTLTGLTSRYFYENFPSTDALAEAAYDECVTTLATSVSSAFSAPDLVTRQIAEAMDALVAGLEQDPRAGHILFSHRINNALITRKRQESTAFFARITAALAEESAVDSSVDVHHAAQFVVGGVTQLLSTWLNSRFDPSPGTGTTADDARTDHPDGPAIASVATTMITALVAQMAVDPSPGTGHTEGPGTDHPA